MVNKLEKGSTITKQVSQQTKKAQPLKRHQEAIEDEKIKYVWSAYMNARRSHIRMALDTR
jgi:hypothetical protein